jgi:hypothetical protein
MIKTPAKDNNLKRLKSLLWCYSKRENTIAELLLMKSDDIAEITQLLGELREEHRDLDLAINRMTQDPWLDQLHMRRMKKRKLKLKDWIARLESKLIPDLDA